MDELWDVARVAEYLGVTERTVYNKVRSGALPAVKVGRLWRVRRNDLEVWLGGQSCDATPPVYPLPAGEITLVQEPGMFPGRDELEARLVGVDDPLDRRLVFVALLTTAVQSLGWTAPVVVGGHAVEFWTGGGYTTVDIDLVGASEPIGQVLRSWGFCKEGRHWYDETLGFVVEAPGSQTEAWQRERVVSVEVAGTTAYVLGVEDIIIDRLCVCVHWSDRESCAWARTLARLASALDVEYLRERAKAEQVEDELESILAGGGAQ